MHTQEYGHFSNDRLAPLSESLKIKELTLNAYGGRSPCPSLFYFHFPSFLAIHVDNHHTLSGDVATPLQPIRPEPLW